MTLHLLKHSPVPLVLQTLSAQTAAPVVVRLLPSDSAPLPANCIIYLVTESPLSQEKGMISYTRLVEMLFEADHVVAW